MVAKNLQFGKLEFRFHRGHEFLLQLIESLDKIGKFAGLFCISSRDVAGVAVNPGAGVNQERPEFCGFLPQLVLIMEDCAVFVQCNDVAIGQFVIRVFDRPTVIKVNVIFGLAGAESLLCSTVSLDGPS